MSLRTALRTSSNRAAVRLLQQVGIPKTVQYAKTMGVGNLPSVPSLALGSGDVTLQSMTAAYAGFDNHGDVPQPLLIRRVEDRSGHLLYESEPSNHACDQPADGVPDDDDDGRRDQRRNGRAGARSLGFTLPAAGKTGTTNDFNDAWFIGFTPSLVAGVWVGFDQPHTILPNGFAADVAVPVWANFMKAATKGDKPVGFSTPPGIVTATVCRLSGKLAAEGCNHAVVLDDHGEVSEPLDGLHGVFRARNRADGALRSASDGRIHWRRRDGVHGLGQAGARPHRAGRAGRRWSSATPRTRRHRRRRRANLPRRRRGFWSRIFGGGKDRANNDNKARQQ